MDGLSRLPEKKEEETPIKEYPIFIVGFFFFLYGKTKTDR